MQYKVALITADAAGIGASTAQKLASLGYFVAILDVAEHTEKFALELNGTGIQGSNQSEEDIRALLDETMKK